MGTRSYAEAAMSYINDSGDPSLSKLSSLDALSGDEAQGLWDVFTQRIGSPADFSSWSGIGDKKDFLPYLRKLVGISDEALKTKFGSILDRAKLTPEQYAYMEKVVDYARENGDIQLLDLQRPPFDETPVSELFSAPEEIVMIKQVVKGLHAPVLWQE